MNVLTGSFGGPLGMEMPLLTMIAVKFRGLRSRPTDQARLQQGQLHGTRIHGDKACGGTARGATGPGIGLLCRASPAPRGQVILAGAPAMSRRIAWSKRTTCPSHARS